jgi:GTP-binding protein
MIDTAGIRRKKKVEYGSEFFMVNRAFKAIRRAEVAFPCAVCD